MATSSIKEKLGKLAVNLAVTKINKWSEQELNRIKTKPQAFCIEYSKKHYGIGDFDIKVRKDGTATVHKDGRFIHRFKNKQAAIYYSAYEKKQKYASSDRLLKADQEVALALSEFLHLKERVKLNKNRKDKEFEFFVQLAKFQEAAHRLKRAEAEFKNSLILAKYNKIWETTT